MKVRFERKWILMRIVYAGLSLGCYITGALSPAIALGLITLQSTFHESIHAITVLILKGNIQEISGTYIDFNTPTLFRARMVYLSGFLFELTCILLAVSVLVLSHNLIFMLIGDWLLFASVIYHIIPPESDFNLCIRSKVLLNVKTI